MALGPKTIYGRLPPETVRTTTWPVSADIGERGLSWHPRRVLKRKDLKGIRLLHPLLRVRANLELTRKCPRIRNVSRIPTRHYEGRVRAQSAGFAMTTPSWKDS